MSSIPATRYRVTKHTPSAINRAIQDKIAASIQFHSKNPKLIDRRLKELDDEWDIERAIEMNAAALAFLGTSLGAAHNKKWLALPLLVTGFLFQHAIQGWCPPIPVLRRMGFRTAQEIEQERYGLLALSKLKPESSQAVEKAVRKAA